MRNQLITVHQIMMRLWTKVIGELFEEYMLIFAPYLYEEIEFSQKPNFLQHIHIYMCKSLYLQRVNFN